VRTKPHKSEEHEQHSDEGRIEADRQQQRTCQTVAIADGHSKLLRPEEDSEMEMEMEMGKIKIKNKKTQYTTRRLDWRLEDECMGK
jgi:hypothetical protein